MAALCRRFGKLRFCEFIQFLTPKEKIMEEKCPVNGKSNPVVVFFMTAFILAVAGCASPPPIRPALSQTVINVQRSGTRLDTGDVYVYVDDRCLNEKTPIKAGQFSVFPVTNGVHYIHAVCKRLGSDLVSEAINFSASSKTVSFVVETVNPPGLFSGSKLVVSRSDVSDDTGTQTDQDMQESYVTVQ
jgi:hypothetical protein